MKNLNIQEGSFAIQVVYMTKQDTEFGIMVPSSLKSPALNLDHRILAIGAGATEPVLQSVQVDIK